jgi:hypothetical protein
LATIDSKPLRPTGLTAAAAAMAFTLPALSYDYASLEPHIDATTMNIHHTKHHQTYVNNVNAALDKFPELKGLGLVDLNQAVGTDKIPAEVATAVRNNGGGHWNHSFFWKVMTAPSNTNGPSAELKAAIDASFGALACVFVCVLGGGVSERARALLIAPRPGDRRPVLCCRREQQPAEDFCARRLSIYKHKHSQTNQPTHPPKK